MLFFSTASSVAFARAADTSAITSLTGRYEDDALALFVSVGMVAFVSFALSCNRFAFRAAHPLSLDWTVFHLAPDFL